MRRWLLAFVTAALLGACGAPPRSSTAPPGPTAPVPQAAALRPKADPPLRGARCSAMPSTVYGEEPVSFVLDADASSAGSKAAFVLKDLRGSVLRRGSVTVPASLVMRDLTSGDYELVVVTAANCFVTVNREMSRSAPAP